MNKVNIYGKDYYFCYNVKATSEMAKLCSGGRIENLQSDIEKMTEGELLEFICKMAVIMNKSANMKINFESGKPIGQWENIESISVDMLMSLDVEEFTTKIRDNIFATMNGDSQTSVEVEPEKKEETQPLS